MVLTILSQSTTDTNRDRAWARLAERFPHSEAVASDLAAAPGPASTHGPASAPGGGAAGASGDEPRPQTIAWDRVRRSAPAELEATIRVAGLARQKSAAIRGVLARLAREGGDPSLAHLERMSDKEALAYLTRFKGVGVKTAACVLCFALRRPVLPVDTHVLRIARRLGWIAETTTATKAHTLLAERVPAGQRFRLHMHLITLGREVCKARSPECHACPLAPDCPKIGVVA